MTENNQLRYFVEVWKHTKNYVKNKEKHAAFVFSPVILEIIDYLYVKDTRKLYDILYENEQKNIPEGLELVEKKQREDYYDYDNDIKNALRNINWDSVLMEIINNISEFDNVLDEKAKEILLNKKEIIDKINRISDNKSRTEKQTNKMKAMFMKLSERVKENHWVYYVYINHWNGSIFDILKSPLFSLVKINYEISNDIKEISDILYELDDIGNPPSISMLLRVRETQDVFDKFADGILYEISKNKNTDLKYSFIINKYLTEKGVSPTEKYFMLNAFFWIIERGFLRNLNKHKDEDPVQILKQMYENIIYPSGSKMLLTYPLGK